MYKKTENQTRGKRAVLQPEATNEQGAVAFETAAGLVPENTNEVRQLVP